MIWCCGVGAEPAGRFLSAQCSLLCSGEYGKSISGFCAEPQDLTLWTVWYFWSLHCGISEL